MRGKQWVLNKYEFDAACELPGRGRVVRWERGAEGWRANRGWKKQLDSVLMFS